MKYIISETNISKNMERRRKIYRKTKNEKNKQTNNNKKNTAELSNHLKGNLSEEKQPRAQH